MRGLALTKLLAKVYFVLNYGIDIAFKTINPMNDEFVKAGGRNDEVNGVRVRNHYARQFGMTADEVESECVVPTVGLCLARQAKQQNEESKR